jgi:tetratricopeptide (TPR) repeat protein
MITIRASRVLLVVTLWSSLPLWPGRVASQDKELTPQERKQLESEARQLHQDAKTEFQQKKYDDALRSLERELAIYERLYPMQDRPNFALTLSNLGAVLSALKQPDKALSYHERALAMRERLYPKRDHVELAQSLYSLGVVLQALEQPAKALTHYERALAMRERLHPKQDDPDLARILNNLGIVVHALGQPEKALSYHELALAMRERLFPNQDHPDLARSLNNLGAVLDSLGQRAKALGQPEKALPYYERALAIQERHHPRQDHVLLARSLNSLGVVLGMLDQPDKALPHLQRALAMRERLFPMQDHRDVAASLNDLGLVLGELGQPTQALLHLKRALAMWEHLYPKQDHRDVAASLDNVGNVFRALGQPEQALPYHEQALAMRQRLYPQQDHPDLAASLNNMGGVLNSLGQPAKALTYHEQTLAMRERLYPKQDHPSLIGSLNNLGSALIELGQPARALIFHERALVLCERLYAQQDHPELATSLNNLGSALWALGQPAKALPYLDRALAVCERLYKQDHSDLVRGMNNLGLVLGALGQPAKALPHFERAVAMRERLYPKQDHPALANSLNNLGLVLYVLGQPTKALPYFERTLAMDRNLVEHAFLDEAQALGRAATLPATRDAYLTVTRDLPAPENAYSHIWKIKAAVTRILQDRRAAVRFALTDPEKHKEFQAVLDELLLKRGQRAFWLHHPAKDLKERDLQIRLITNDIEKLERRLGNAFPESPRRQELARFGPADLVKRLPDGTAFIDLIRYTHFKNGNPHPWYVAFVLSGAGGIHRVELEAATDIDLAVDLWRQAVSGWSPSLKAAAQRELQDKADKQAAKLRRLVWEPLARHLPKDAHTVYLAPDGNLARFAFAALPGSKPGTILLEELSIAYVPHGPALLERLVYPPQLAEGSGNALAVGGVQYDAIGGKANAPWHDLKATAHERDELKRLAGKRSVLALSGPGASVARLMEELPKAGYAHLATHGFFKEKEFAQEQQRLAQQLKHYEFVPERVTHVAHQGAQSPLVFAGLVLAGANAPSKAGTDGGLLVAETIGNLPLEGLRLAVLSACETGLGEQTRGEAVQSLQLAFHLAGCPDVIASLWQVNDGATAVLMAKFYHELWVKNRPPIAALRQAQLLIYLRPDLVEELAGDERGPPRLEDARRRDILERGVAAPASVAPPGTRRAPTKLWAAFVLSGTGR